MRLVPEQDRRGLRPSGVNGCLRALKAMLSYFVREDVLTASPIKHVRLVREPKALIAVYSTRTAPLSERHGGLLGPALAVDLAVASLQVGLGSFSPG